jgi:hypothetical protein
MSETETRTERTDRNGECLLREMCAAVGAVTLAVLLGLNGTAIILRNRSERE